jgi:hypothetical protein
LQALSCQRLKFKQRPKVPFFVDLGGDPPYRNGPQLLLKVRSERFWSDQFKAHKGQVTGCFHGPKNT